MKVFRTRHVAVMSLPLSLGATLAGCGSGAVDQQNLLQDAQGSQQAFFSQSQAVAQNRGPAGTSGLTLNEVRYPLDSAIGDVWGVLNNHYKIDFTFTNGNLTVESKIVDGSLYQVLAPGQGTAVFYATVLTPGSSFDFAAYSDYTFVDDATLKRPGVGYFVDAYVGVDSNRNGFVDLQEQLPVIDGIISFEGFEPDIRMYMSVTLSNGQSVEGDYGGLFEYTKR